MSKETGLEKIATRDSYWTDVAGKEGDISESLDTYAQGLAASVAVGLVNIKDLRQLVKLANILDGEAYEYAEGNMRNMSMGELEEASARRFAHHGMKKALELVNSWGQRNLFFALNDKSDDLPDLSRLGNGYLLE